MTDAAYYCRPGERRDPYREVLLLGHGGRRFC
jgi:hypothetical protein